MTFRASSVVLLPHEEELKEPRWVSVDYVSAWFTVS